MIYARAHDQTVADDYFAAMQRVEQRLDIVPKKEEDTCTEPSRSMGDVKVQVVQLIQRLEMPELCYE